MRITDYDDVQKLMKDRRKLLQVLEDAKGSKKLKMYGSDYWYRYTDICAKIIIADIEVTIGSIERQLKELGVE